MPLSYTEITLTDDGGVDDKDNTEFSFDFDYINTGDIKARVTLNPGAETPTWTDALTNSGATGSFDANGIDATNKKIKLAASPASSPTNGVVASVLRIYRATTLDSLVDFQGGSRVSEADLDNAYRQGLFAAQEVSENASTQGGAAGALTVGSVDHQHIVTDGVRRSEIMDGEVITAKIANDAVGVNQMADSLDFTSEPTTVILPTANRNLASLDANYIFQGPLRVGAGGTGLNAYANSDVLEKITGVCNGTTVTRHPLNGVESSFVMPNVTAIQSLGTSWTEVTGSAATYRPPTDATRIEYEFSFMVSKDALDASQGVTYFRLMFTDESLGNPQEVTSARFTCGGGEDWHGGLIHFKWVFGRHALTATPVPDGIVGPTTEWDATRKVYLEAHHEADAIPTLARRKVGVTSAVLSSNVLSVVTAADWIDLEPGRTEVVKLDGTWANAVTDPTGYKKATFTYNNAFTIPLTGANQSSYAPGAAAFVYSWVNSDIQSDVRLHAPAHFGDLDTHYVTAVRKPVLTITAIK